MLAIDLGPRFASFRASDQPAPTPGSARIFVDVIAPTAPAAPPRPARRRRSPPLPPAAPEAPPLLDLPTPGGLRAIVIDAGHGGDDTGAKGAQGTLEKNVTLSVARRLKAALEARLGVRVLLTRDGDQAVASDQRAAVANNNKADLFISLHANASLRPAVAGAEVFYLESRRLRRRGAAARRRAPPTRCRCSAAAAATSRSRRGRWRRRATSISRRRSRSAIEAALRERVPMSPRSLQQGPFRVLVGANMPAVLVELGFLTNAEQEQQLAGDEHQNALVQALVEGIVRYRAATAGARADAAPPSRHRRHRRLRPGRGLGPVHRPATLVCGAPDAGGHDRSRAAAPRRPAAVRKITATLFYVSDDGMALTPVQREVPFGATSSNRRAPSSRRRSRGAAPLVSAIPAETKLRDVFITERGDAFVDLSGDLERQAPRRLARRDLHRLHHRQRAHGEPAGR